MAPTYLQRKKQGRSAELNLDQAKQEAAKIRSNYLARIAEIRRDPELNGAVARRSAARTAEDDARAKMRDVRRQLDAARAETISRLEHKLFSVKDADKGALREGLSQVGQLRDSGELRAALNRARRTDDKALAKAVFIRAHEVGARGVMDEYLANDADLQKADADLQTLQSADGSRTKMALAIVFNVPSSEGGGWS